MAGPLPVAFLWHLHQPLYRDPVTGVYRLPWARLHGVGAYTSMVLLAAEFPELPLTFNVVPSLVLQIQAYADGTATDPWLEVASKPADALDADEYLFLLRRFFLAHPETMIGSSPRYRELWELRGRDLDPRALSGAAARWTVSALRDLQVWFHLAWTSPVARERDPVLAELEQKGRGFTEADKAVLFDAQRRLLGALVGRYAALEADGAAELSTSPFFHPILPLLCDLAVTREADPSTCPPPVGFAHPEDALAQLEMAVKFHRQRFGKAPVGLWPSEGGVSEAVISLARNAGFRWLATDEIVLGRSLALSGGNPATWPRPAVWEESPEVALFFRQHDLSDRIGFRYATVPARAAVQDLLAAVHRIQGSLPPEAGDAVVTLALDGENPWQAYPGQGVEFLRTLYAALLKERALDPTTPGRWLAARRPALRLRRLAPGSWIDGTFRIWAGHPEDHAAWTLLAGARETLEGFDVGRLEPEAHARARDALYIAEGSDWTWWYGDDHSSGMDEVFDELFRGHIEAIYRALRIEAPPQVLQPICRSREDFFEHVLPAGRVAPILDGRVTHFFEWQAAGQLLLRGGAMDTGRWAIRRLFYGFGGDGLWLRLDPDPRRWPLRDGRLLLVVVRPVHASWELPLGAGHWRHEGGEVEIAVADTIELRVSAAVLGPESSEVEFLLRLREGDAEIQQILPGGPVRVYRPGGAEVESVW